MKNNRNDKKILESLIKKYGSAGVKNAINKLNEALDKPLFRKPINFIGGTQDDIFKTLDQMINDGELDYVDIWDVYTKYDINDELVYEILARNNWKNVSPNNRRFVLDMFGKYFDNAYAEHLVDIDNDGMAYIVEDIDTGQYTSARDRKSSHNNIDNDYYLKVRKLRRALDNTDDPIEIRKIQKRIDQLKQEYGLNEWNMWDGDKRRTYSDNRMSITHNHQSRYKDDPEYHEHIKRLEAQLRKTTDPQEAEYLERRINKLKSLSESKTINKLNKNRIYESIYYDYDEDLFNPKDCLTWLIQNGLLDRFNSSYDIDKWAEMAQYAAEDAGVPLDDAERVYDIAYMKYAR